MSAAAGLVLELVFVVGFECHAVVVAGLVPVHGLSAVFAVDDGGAWCAVLVGAEESVAVDLVVSVPVSAGCCCGHVKVKGPRRGGYLSVSAGSAGVHVSLGGVALRTNTTARSSPL